jgi:hypothetical protein
MSVASRLSEVLESSEEISFDNFSKFILFGDCHRGDNSWADDFAPMLARVMARFLCHPWGRQ